MSPLRALARARAVAAPFALTASLACGSTDEPDAYGNFEATETVVSAETGGALLWFTPVEGQQVAPGTLLGVIDTTRLALDREQLGAQRTAVRSRVSEAERQIGVLAVQREIAGRAYARTRRLFAEQAATAQQMDQAEREYRVLGEQIAAVRAQRSSVTQDVAASDARVAQIAERIAKSRISAPFAGTVLATYARTGEYVQPGQPLFRLASLDTLTLRAYVTEPQLAELKLGQRVHVNVDRGEGQRLAVPGTVSWISSKAEFTPTPVQTRDERADLVYAVKIRVPNQSGVLKIGMPADVTIRALSGA
ncbi:MAG TPA: HlyD family efflux transporter periplasmic adaptor subunit [Gemmatimonadaceae bacterium]|nr:HlyD family efflux transporter periplasmic adaptor subunit [Gemmatimonadaceae bacterium]